MPKESSACLSPSLPQFLTVLAFRASRGVSGNAASESAHVDVNDLPGCLASANMDITNEAAYDRLPTLPPTTMANLPGPVLEAREAQAAIVYPVQPIFDSQTQRTEVEPSEERVNGLDPVKVAKALRQQVLQRAETGDSVQIVGDVLA